VSQGTRVGTLVAAPRRGESTLDPRDGAVLADLARQAGAAVHAEALTADLVASRQRIVEAREEERRRLRRDLHDGLGPLLTSVGLNLDAARSRLTSRDGDPLALLGADGEDILAAVRSAAAGQAVFGAALAPRLRTFFGDGRARSATTFPQLTERERLILGKLAAGLTKCRDR
jgi:signal transduction histidine kinase